MTTSAEETTLHESLDKLETCLLSPVVPGELLDWVDAVRTAAGEVRGSFEAYIRDVLHPRYAEIAKSDTELLFRIQQATEEDQKLQAELDAFSAELEKLAREAPDAQKDELRVADQCRRVENRGTQFILAVRKHRLAVSTWLDEAIFRDRGPGD
jgi:hypothetical protein